MPPACPLRITLALVTLLSATAAEADDLVRAVVDAAVEPVMVENGIPGLSVALSIDGERHVFHYGLASRESGASVGDRTLFEIGSLSKPFTGTLGAILAAEGAIDLSAPAQSVESALSGTPIGGASLLELATYTAGGLPLQFPDGIDESRWTDWYRGREAQTAIGTSRLYSNPSIGLFGHLAAEGAGGSFAELLDRKVLGPLDLDDTMLAAPAERRDDYAQGYTRDGVPVRVNPGLFDDEAYGIKTTAADLLRFVEASMTADAASGDLGEGLREARAGRYRVKAMHQGLGWELYPAPASLADLRQGADPSFVLEPNPVERVEVPVVDPALVGTVSKTGSTSGFGAYALFSPERGTAIVILANRFWPNAARIETAHAILSELDPGFAD